jgi:hypothetical protein
MTVIHDNTNTYHTVSEQAVHSSNSTYHRGMVIAWAQQLAQLTHPRLHLPLVDVGSLKAIRNALLISLSLHPLPQQAFFFVGSADAKRKHHHLRQSLTTNSYSKAATSIPVEGEALCYPSSPSRLFGVGHDPCPNLS